MTSPVPHGDSSYDEVQSVLTALETFLNQLNNREWLSLSSKEEIRSCLQCAKKIEIILETLHTKDCLESIISLTPNLCSYNIDQLKKVSDVVLGIVLMTPGLPLPIIRICIDEYLQLCGTDRFEHVLSSTIFCSEIYRVLLDYLASSESDLGEAQINLQSYVFSQIWKNVSDVEKLQHVFYEWMEEDTSGQNVAIALMVIIFEDDLYSNTYISLVDILSKVLHERKDLALVYWRILTESPQTKKALERSPELFTSTLEFLKTTAQWMEATATATSFTWISREKGACAAFGFGELISAIKGLLDTGGLVTDQTKQFLLRRKNSMGCTLWYDIEIEINY